MKMARYDDLIEKYENPIEHTCDMRLGQEFISVGGEKPENMCDFAWESMAAFSSQTIDFADEEITVAKIGAVFGGAKCNLTDAKIKDGSQLDLFCAFGGADIIVPENVNVKVNTFSLFGGISDKRTIKSVDKDGVTLAINGFCIFGGADIK